MSARDALRAHLNGQPPPPDPADALREASDLLGLTDPFVRCVRTIPSMDAPMTATTASGVEVRWERQSDAMERRTFVRPFLAAGLAPPPPAKQMSTEHVYALLVRAATLTAEHDAQDEARDWLEGFAQTCEEREADFTDPAAKYLSTLELAQRKITTYGEPSLLLVDTTGGWRYARRGDVAFHVRRGYGVTIGASALTGRLSEVGVEACDLQVWTPDCPRDEAVKAKARTYRWRS